MTVRQPRGLVILVALLLAPASYAQPTSAHFDSNGVGIHYVDSGRGVPVVLLHGFTGTYARHIEMPGLSTALQTAGYRVIGIDCRGHGDSGKPHDAAQYGLEMVRDVVRLLDHLGIDRAHVVGYSMGGAIALQLLVRYPERLRTVSLIGSGWEGENPQQIRSEMLALSEAFSKRDATALIRGVSAGGQTALSDQQVAAANAALFARNDGDALAAAAKGLIPLFDVPTQALRSTKIPVIAITGERDLRNLPSAKRMSGVVPSLELVELPGATHATSVKSSTEHVVAFLAKHGGG